MEREELVKYRVIQETITLSSYARRDDEFYYYATHGGREVDLVIDRGRQGLVFIEIKSTNRVTDDDLRHLKAFNQEEKLKDASFYCFSLDKNAAKRGDSVCLHWEEGLRELGLFNSPALLS